MQQISSSFAQKFIQLQEVFYKSDFICIPAPYKEKYRGTKLLFTFLFSFHMEAKEKYLQDMRKGKRLAYFISSY